MASGTAGFAFIATGWAWWLFSESGLTVSAPGYFRTLLWLVVAGQFCAAIMLLPSSVGAVIAGDRATQALPMLMITALRPAEILAGRCCGRFLHVLFVQLSIMPVVVATMAFAQPPVRISLWLLALPLAVAVGVGGVSLLISTISRRGRHATVASYLVVLLLILAPSVAGIWLPTEWDDWLRSFNPFGVLRLLIYEEQSRSAAICSASWAILGIGTFAVASWQLWPAHARLNAGGKGRRAVRRLRVPPVSDHPMMWKEVYVERMAVFGKWWTWGGRLLLLSMWVLTVLLVIGGIWERTQPTMPDWVLNMNSTTSALATRSTLFFVWLLQWAIGLRAAAAIASERERTTWECLILSPLSINEIFFGKLRGSLQSMGILAVSCLALWTAAAVLGMMPWADFTYRVLDAIVGSVLIAVVGLAWSLRAPSTAQAMTFTMGSWLMGSIAIVVSSGILAMIVVVVGFVISLYEQYLSTVPLGGAMAPINPAVPYGVISLLLQLALILTLVPWILSTFDLYAGRKAVELFVRVRSPRTTQNARGSAGQTPIQTATSPPGAVNAQAAAAAISADATK